MESESTSAPLALLAVTHGAPSAENRAAVVSLVDAITARNPAADVSIDFIDAQHTDVASALTQATRTRGAVIVPLVLSAGYHVRAGLALGLDRLEGEGVELAAALGPDPRIVDVLAARLEAIGLQSSDALILAAAGSNDPRAVRECFETGRRLAARLGRPVTVGFIAAAIPRLPDAIEMVREVHPGSRVVIGTYLLAPGNFYDSVLAAGGDVVAEPLIVPGSRVEDGLVELVLDRYAEAAMAGARTERGAGSER
ncbi:cobalamin biosynthesis protein CbiX [Agromyces atrinae]|uniref:sirohydrochlorin chelatase n=1 Tax=Agromyces atrinae TaxID=592376 RepID=UPI001F55EE80|nr:CbiX/SirB N-terminal domain-containing protein [Agromyces atrinae]MCI2958128.1 cobalamin biosynthesis protein CbiX [Agromyces atrinae]